MATIEQTYRKSRLQAYRESHRQLEVGESRRIDPRNKRGTREVWRQNRALDTIDTFFQDFDRKTETLTARKTCAELRAELEGQRK